MAREKVVLKGAGMAWFPLLKHFVGTNGNRGPFFDLNPGELRLYVVLSMECHKAGSTSFVRLNEYMREFTGLDRNYLPRARKGLMERGLIHARRAGKESFRYAPLGTDNKSESVDRSDDAPTFFDVPDGLESAIAA